MTLIGLIHGDRHTKLRYRHRVWLYAIEIVALEDAESAGLLEMVLCYQQGKGAETN